MHEKVNNDYNLSSLIKELPFLGDYDPSGKRILLRADFNVPVDENGTMNDDGRLRALRPTIDYLLDRRATVILASHFRNPLIGGDMPDPKMSLGPMTRRLSRIWEAEVVFSPEPVGAEVSRRIDALRPGQILLLENLRFHPGEASGDLAFAQELSSLADVYVNDAFGVCHRSHVSMVTITKFMKTALAGFALRNELRAINLALSDPPRPLTAIVGGQHIEAKWAVLTKLMTLADNVIVGGLIGDILARRAFGHDISHYNLPPQLLTEMELILKPRASSSCAKLFIPIDAVTVSATGRTGVTAVQHLTSTDIPKDIGPASCLWFKNVLNESQTIIWSGPMGSFETPSYAKGTAMVVQALANCQGVTLAGGVDTSSAILKMGSRSQISFLSTGGSAFFKALAGQPLVALEALRQRP